MIPERIFAGTSFEATYSLAQLPSQGWSSLVIFRGEDGFYQLEAVAVGDTFKISATAEVAATWKAGEYCIFIYATKDGEKLVCDDSGHIIILPDPMSTVTKSVFQQELIAVDKAIAGVLAGEGVQDYSFETAHGRRSASRMDLKSLRDHRRYLEGKIDQEKTCKSGKPSRHGFRTIRTKWSS